MWDLSLPGYKYLGPGNRLDKGRPNNKNDAAAREHDILYGKYLRRGQNPYTNYNNADEKAIQQFTNSDYGGALGKLFFKGKRYASSLGILGRLDEPVRKRLRGTNLPVKPSSFSISPPTTNMSDGGGSGNAPGLKETPVDDPYVVYRGPPDYTFCSLPYIESRVNAVSSTSSVDHVYRMTSVYDTRVETTALDYNAGAGIQNVYQESESTQRKARWFDYYSGIYNYYHVIGCRWNIFIENMSGEPIWCYAMFYNDTYPSQYATNEDMQLWGGVQYKYLDRRYLAVQAAGTLETGDVIDNEIIDENGTQTDTRTSYETANHVSNMAKQKCVFSGEYKPGDFRREIHLDSEVENWTAVTTNPSLPEKLMIRISSISDRFNSNSAFNAGDTLKYKIQVKLNYLVEFKELKDSLKYPIQRQPLTVTIAADPTSTN